MTATTTAIVVSYHTGPRLKECLYALDSDPAVRSIRIVDNGNPPEMRSWLEGFSEKRADVHVLDAGGNVGFGAAVNFGAAGVADGHLLVINPDAVLKRGSVEAMIDALAGQPSPCIVGGKVFDLAGLEVRGPRRRKLTLLRALTTFSGWNTWTLEGTPPPDGPRPMGAVSGALMLATVQDFRSLGGFDEEFFMHVEDVDICRRASEAGGQTVYTPLASALHYGATSEAPAKRVAGYKADSLIYYFNKHASGPVERAVIGVIAPLLRAAIVGRARDQG
ncbi:glycosyltransferase [Henriciella marina]|uniref:glycosyltransferase n=1 Tax=Henriciella marina TaxID=453851 RepID=UPI00036E8CBB|nr:glycosyltransferase family 2 protein [Henriciella marina]